MLEVVELEVEAEHQRAEHGEQEQAEEQLAKGAGVAVQQQTEAPAGRKEFITIQHCSIPTSVRFFLTELIFTPHT